MEIINQKYISMLKDKSVTKETKKYLQKIMTLILLILFQRI